MTGPCLISAREVVQVHVAHHGDVGRVVRGAGAEHDAAQVLAQLPLVHREDVQPGVPVPAAPRGHPGHQHILVSLYCSSNKIRTVNETSRKFSHFMASFDSSTYIGAPLLPVTWCLPLAVVCTRPRCGGGWTCCRWPPARCCRWRCPPPPSPPGTARQTPPPPPSTARRAARRGRTSRD